MSDLNLATIQTIEKLEPIDGCDAIETATIMGWQVVVKKNEFKPNDKCVYIEIDTIVPENTMFEFLRKNKFRIKTVKIRRQISQGIAFPLSILPSKEYLIGEDVTEILGIKKYEKEIPQETCGSSHRTFPSYVPITDETRIQSVKRVLEEIKGKIVYITTKIDGTSATFITHGDERLVCSRKMIIEEEKEGKGVYWNIYNKYKIKDILDKHQEIAIQGEIAGPGIQKNRLELKEAEFFVFNIYDIINKKYYDFEQMKKFCQVNNLQIVPIEQENITFIWTLEELLEMAKGKYVGTKNNKEGIVVRTMIETLSKKLQGRMSFKVVNNDYLLKDEE